MINSRDTPSRSVTCFIKNNFGGFACYDNTITVILIEAAAAAATAGGVDKCIRLRDNIHLVGKRRI